MGICIVNVIPTTGLRPVITAISQMGKLRLAEPCAWHKVLKL